MPLQRLSHHLVTMLFMAALPGAGLAISVPDSVTLNTNGALYKPFSFNHAKHIRDIKECSDCHHHTTGTLIGDANCARCHSNSDKSANVSCRGCHSTTPFSAASLKELNGNPKRYHRDKPGLKGAMHQSCIGCHTRQKSGPVGCEECHTRREAGHALYNSGPYTPKKVAGKHGAH